VSQIFKDMSSGPVPPAVPTSFTTDVRDNSTTSPGTAIPALNILQVLGSDTTQNNDNGIRTDANPNNGNVLYVELTNRMTGTASTVGAVTADIITFSLGASTAVYRFNFLVAGRDTAGAAVGQGVGYTIDGSARTDGAAATIISTPDIDADEDTAIMGSLISFIASDNNIIVRATGVAGETISYNAVGTYVVV